MKAQTTEYRFLSSCVKKILYGFAYFFSNISRDRSRSTIWANKRFHILNISIEIVPLKMNTRFSSKHFSFTFGTFFCHLIVSLCGPLSTFLNLVYKPLQYLYKFLNNSQLQYANITLFVK